METLNQTMSVNGREIIIHFAGDGQPSTCIFWKFQFLPIEIVDVHLEFEVFFLMIFSCEHGLSCWKPVSFSGKLLVGGFKYLLFSSRSLGKWANLTNIFQMGWNHQPDYIWDPSLFSTKSDIHSLVTSRDFWWLPEKTDIDWYLKITRLNMNIYEHHLSKPSLFGFNIFVFWDLFLQQLQMLKNGSSRDSLGLVDMQPVHLEIHRKSKVHGSDALESAATRGGRFETGAVLGCLSWIFWIDWVLNWWLTGEPSCFL